MSATVSYEIHVMRGGRWVNTGIYQDKDDALRDARGGMRKRYLGIRVIEEIFDPERERFVTRTIYRDQSNPQGPGSSRPAPEMRPFAMAVNRNSARAGHPFRVAAFSLVALSSVMLAGIAGMLWLGLV